jgi:FkbM family methyltransferase
MRIGAALAKWLGGIPAAGQSAPSRFPRQTSQVGQDTWVFGEVFNGKRGGYFVDLGAHDGVALSNTYLLEKKYGWSGICVEANPETFSQLRRNRGVRCVEACLDAGEGWVEFAKRNAMGGIISTETDNKPARDRGGKVVRMRTRTLESVLDENGAPREIDYLSVDLEGAEERVLEGFNFGKYRFRAVTIERPSGALQALLARQGYRLVKEIPGLDFFYIHEDFMVEYGVNLMAFGARMRAGDG